MRTSRVYYIYALGAHSVYDGDDVSEDIADFNEEEKELFAEAEKWYRKFKNEGKACPMVRIPDGLYED